MFFFLSSLFLSALWGKVVAVAFDFAKD